MENNQQPTGFVFDKESYRTRLEFFIRFSLVCNSAFSRMYGLTYATDINSVACKCFCNTAFELRYFGITLVDSNNNEMLQAHYEYLVVALNQFNEKFTALQAEALPLPIKLSKMEIMIKETSKELTEEIGDFITNNDNYAQHSSSKGE